MIAWVSIGAVFGAIVGGAAMFLFAKWVLGL